MTKNAVIKYLEWLKDFNPLLYAAVKVKRPDIFQRLKADGLAYLSADETIQVSKPWYANILQTVADTAKMFVPVYQQKKLFDTQVDLAKKGLPMLSNDQILAAGTTSIQVDLPPDIKGEVIKTARTTQSGINWTVMALIAGGGFLLYTMTQKKGRR